ncbi:MAG: 5'/3'-nucleotidase SurE [Deltaproteobacteria bacterium]|nr:5'/3'-nucleotidase SurE [Deltaproteobacteria bacterium]
MPTTPEPLILLTNDDGIRSEALDVTREVLGSVGRVVIVAPDGQRSASGHSITLGRCVSVTEKGEDRFALSGTPVDCVYLACATLLPRIPDLVVSGVNLGLNVGTDVFYSGTVSAAVEGAIRGSVGIALSSTRFAGPEQWKAAARFTVALFRRLGDRKGDAYNVNVPEGSISGYRWTALGSRRYPLEATRCEDPWKRSHYWLGGDGLGTYEGAVGPDVDALQQGFISVSPMHLDLTSYSRLPGPDLDWPSI